MEPKQGVSVDIQKLGIQLNRPLMAFAPMKGYSTHFFLEILAETGLPDLFYTEFSRVHGTSRPEEDLIELATQKRIDCPVIVQLMGNDPQSLVRAIEQWQALGVKGIDLNVGCPVRKIYRKAVGGGLLKDLKQLNRILSALRKAYSGHLSVKLRPGFEDTKDFAHLLEIVGQNGIDLVTLHARTVKEAYSSNLCYELIAQAVQTLKCPVLANGDLTSVNKVQSILEQTKCAGVMIGRSAIRNPWIFSQLKAFWSGSALIYPTLGHARSYVEQLEFKLCSRQPDPLKRLNLLKSFGNMIGQSVDAEGEFLYWMRRADSLGAFFSVCDDWLLKRQDMLIALEPYPNVFALPNKEQPR